MFPLENNIKAKEPNFSNIPYCILVSRYDIVWYVHTLRYYDINLIFWPYFNVSKLKMQGQNDRWHQQIFWIQFQIVCLVGMSFVGFSLQRLWSIPTYFEKKLKANVKRPSHYKAFAEFFFLGEIWEIICYIQRKLSAHGAMAQISNCHFYKISHKW